MENSLLALIVITLTGNLIVLGAILIPLLRTPSGSSDGSTLGADIEGRLAAAAVTGALEDDPEGAASTHAYDRVVRVVSWVFILIAGVIVLGTGLWPETQQAILILLALAGVFLILVNDVLPSNALGSAKFVVEGSVALTGAAMLVALTEVDLAREGNDGGPRVQ